MRELWSEKAKEEVMGRPPALTDRQKAEIGRRLAQGESAASLAKEFKVGRATMTRCFSGRLKTIKEVATKLAEAEIVLEHLPVSEQVAIRDLTDHLKGITTNATQAAETGMKTANLLHTKALAQVESLENPTVDDLRLSDALLTVAGKASALGVSLMASNKDAGREPDRATLGSLLGQTKAVN